MATLLHRTPPHPEASGGGFRCLPWEHGDYHDGMGPPTARSGGGTRTDRESGRPSAHLSEDFRGKEVQIGGGLWQLPPFGRSLDRSKRGF